MIFSLINMIAFQVLYNIFNLTLYFTLCLMASLSVLMESNSDFLMLFAVHYSSLSRSNRYECYCSFYYHLS